jgi:glutamine synthetase
MELIEKSGAPYVQCMFSDVRGIIQSFNIPAKEVLKDSTWESGIGFDGSSVRGFKSIDESDMIWKPDPATARMLPWIDDPIQKTVVLFGDVYEAFGGGPAACDPRGAAKRAVEKAAEMGYTVVMAPEIEFFVFDDFDPMNLLHDWWASPNGGKSDAWGGPRPLPHSSELNTIRPKEGYFRAPPDDSTHDFRNELAFYLTQMGVEIEYHHHEVATAGQVELNFRPTDPVTCGDYALLYKYTAKNLAHRRGMRAVFMPKPLYLDNASGMHVHQSLWEKGKPAFYDEKDGYAELSQIGRYYVGGLLKHARALAAVCCPTVNSYKRLVPGFEAPINIMWSRRNRSALTRIPVYKKGPGYAKEKRAEYRGADPSANPYLAFACMVAAGLDGIKNKINPPGPVDHDVYEMTEAEKQEHGIGKLPTSLCEAIQALEEDAVIQGALGEQVSRAFTELKANEWNQYCLQITPWEVAKYIDY